MDSTPGVLEYDKGLDLNSVDLPGRWLVENLEREETSQRAALMERDWKP